MLLSFVVRKKKIVFNEKESHNVENFKYINIDINQISRELTPTNYFILNTHELTRNKEIITSFIM